MKKKELILILAYCNTKEKKKTLFEFLDSLQKFRNDYDILVSSHSPLDTFYFEYFDYYFYDKNNIILTDIEYRQNVWFLPFDNYVIWSSYIDVGNTLKAIWDITIPSISIAKTMDYEKIHMFEYDTKVINDNELKDNSRILNEYDYVIYGSEDTHKLVGSFISYNVKNIITEWEKIDETNLKNLFYNKYPKVPENVTYELIKTQKKFYKKNFNDLKNNGIILNKITGNPVSWDVPFFDPKDNKLKFLSKNTGNSKYDVKVIINDNLINVGEINPNSWKIIDLMDNFYDVKSVIVFRDNSKILEIDFNSDGFKDKFVYYNSVLDNSSIGIK